MEGKQMANSERKGPHKSMHCKFCKPPGAFSPEKFTEPQMEMKTKLRLVHEAADLKLLSIHDEPSVPVVEFEACTCVLEGDNPCPKCAPDKNNPPKKKKVCRCPKGAKPHPSTLNDTTPKKPKKIKEDNEFWWEKYDREHDALAKETWAAYMAQRKKEKKLEKCQKREAEALMASNKKGCPYWFQKLSCQQMIYVEYLSTAIRLDSDENITDRTLFVLGGIGLYPRPSIKILKKCIRFCHYNAIQFLNQLHMLIKDDDLFEEKKLPSRHKHIADQIFTWNERLIMNSICYLEFPSLLRELMDRLPQLPRPKKLPIIPYPVFPKSPKTKYESPYDEPIWQDRLNWVEKRKIDRINRCRLYMETKRVKIPALALVRRSSLIDARPPFLSQIEANEQAARRLAKEKMVKVRRKRPIPTFDSAVDVTAIAGIEASEISTTDKADTDDICVFLREPKEEESMMGEMEEEPDFQPEKEVRFSEESKEDSLKLCFNLDEYSEEEEEGELAVNDMPFRTPPKTESGRTIGSPCLPPDTTPAPPATHFEKGKRELDIINKEICGFYPFVTPSTHTTKEDANQTDEDVELNLRFAAAKLKKYVNQEKEEVPDEKSQKKKRKKSKKQQKYKKKTHKKKRKTPKTSKSPTVIEMPGTSTENEEEEEEEVEDTVRDDDVEFDEKGQIIIKLKMDTQKSKSISKKESEISDPDPDSDDEWSTRFPCPPEVGEEEDEQPEKKQRKRRGKTCKRKSRKSSPKSFKLKEIFLKKKQRELKDEKKKKVTSFENTETETTPKSNLSEKNKEEEEKEPEKDKVEVFTGDVEPLVQKIIQDLADEGYYSAAFPLVEKHPDIEQLIGHLKGKFISKELKESLLVITKARWSQMADIKKLNIQDLGITQKTIERATWNDKKWVSRLAKKKLNQFYYTVANTRTQYGMDFYDTLYQGYFGTERYLKIYYAYMISKYEDAILRGIC